MLGIREPEIYGRADYSDLLKFIDNHAASIGVDVEVFQSNHEGDLIDKIQQAYRQVDGIVINPAAFTHTSVGLLDALKAVGIPAVEVHISDPDTREEFRKISYVRAACVATIKGHGIAGYGEAMDYLKEHFEKAGVEEAANSSRRCSFAPILKSPDKNEVNYELNEKAMALYAPPSKSMAHRYLICAALACGESYISGIELSEDVKATMNCLSKLGADISIIPEVSDDECGKNGLYTVVVKGIDKSACTDESSDTKYMEPPVLDCNECGSTLRFMIPVVTLMYSMGYVEPEKPVRLTGSKKLLSRPLSAYDDVFTYTYVSFSHNESYVQVMGSLTPGEYRVPGDVSSQFITGMLFALPLLKWDSRLNIIPPVESRPYIEMTVEVLHDFGVDIEWVDDNTIRIPGNQHYLPIRKRIEGDWANGAVLLTFARLYGRLDQKIVVKGLSDDSVQGDKIIMSMFDHIDRGEPADISDYPDLGPILLAYMAARNGGTLIGTSRLALKESDRGQAMKQELEKMGVTVTVGRNDITVDTSAGLTSPSSVIDSHNDHRIAMSMSVLCSLYGGIIDGADAVSKSYPSFFEVLKDMGIRVKSERIIKD